MIYSYVFLSVLPEPVCLYGSVRPVHPIIAGEMVPSDTVPDVYLLYLMCFLRLGASLTGGFSPHLWDDCPFIFGLTEDRADIRVLTCSATLVPATQQNAPRPQPVQLNRRDKCIDRDSGVSLKHLSNAGGDY